MLAARLAGPAGAHVANDWSLRRFETSPAGMPGDVSKRTKRRDEALITQINTDPHAPEEFRINGVVRNIDAWYEAFDVKPGDELYLAPEERVRIW